MNNIIDYPARFSKESRDGLWELIGFRVRGMDSPILGAVHFQRQEPASKARRALSDYLSRPPVKPGLSETSFPRHLVPVAVKRDNESFLGFTERLNRGDEPRIVHLAQDCIEVAFDLRPDNPSIEKQPRLGRGESERRVFRTVEGHVLIACVASLAEKLHRDQAFLGLQRVQQLTSCGTLDLPNLIVHRKYFAMTLEWSENLDWFRSSILRPTKFADEPILGATAYRFFRDRVGQPEPRVTEAS